MGQVQDNPSIMCIGCSEYSVALNTIERAIVSAFWIWGYPDLPARGPLRGSIDGLVRPSFSIDNSRPLRGAKPRELDDTKTSLGGLPQGGSRGAEISMQGAPREVRMT